MALVKICPSCGAENDINTTLCDMCMADISAVNPIDTDVPETASIAENLANTEVIADSSATVIERRRLLHFTASDGSGGFTVASGAVIGREAEGREYLASHMTVSRRHAKINFNGSWFIEDLNSSNGTFINENKIVPNEPQRINNGDSVALSHSCVFTVKEQ